MTVYLVSAIEIHDRETYKRYSEGAQKALAPFKVEYLSGDDNPAVYEGERPANHLNVIGFESKEKFDEFFNSEAYQAIIPIRQASSTTKFIMLMQPPG
jgi:uncharacterized protein (DUF1330 family)